MFGKTFVRIFCAWMILIILTGCAPKPVKVEPIASPTQTEPLSTPVVTEVPSEAAATSAPVENSFVASKAEDVVGLWNSCCDHGNTLFFKYNPDGTIQIAQPNGLDAIKNTKNGVVNKFWFDGTVFHIQDINDPTSPCADMEGTYKLTVTQLDGQNSELKFEVINEPCKDRKLLLSKITHWVSS